MKIKPLGDRVLVKRIEPREEVRGGIIIPDTAKEGQTVLIGKYSGQDIKINDEEHTILREDEILAIVEK